MIKSDYIELGENFERGTNLIKTGIIFDKNSTKKINQFHQNHHPSHEPTNTHPPLFGPIRIPTTPLPPHDPPSIIPNSPSFSYPIPVWYVTLNEATFYFAPRIPTTPRQSYAPKPNTTTTCIPIRLQHLQMHIVYLVPVQSDQPIQDMWPTTNPAPPPHTSIHHINPQHQPRHLCHQLDTTTPSSDDLLTPKRESPREY